MDIVDADIGDPPFVVVTVDVDNYWCLLKLSDLLLFVVMEAFTTCLLADFTFLESIVCNECVPFTFTVAPLLNAFFVVLFGMIFLC